MVIYIDIFILENTILNMIIFVSTVIVSKTKVSFVKIVIISFLGSLYSLVEYLYLNSNISFIENMNGNLLKTILKIVIVFILISIFFKGDIKSKIKFCFIYLMISFIYSGIGYFININFYDYLVLDSNIGVFTWKNICISFIVSFILCLIFSKCNNNGLNQENRICNIEICLDNKNIKLKALIDSGNMLKEPITGKEVIIVESKSIKKILDLEDIRFFKNIAEGKILDEISDKNNNTFNDNNDSSTIKYEYKYKYNIKVIPFSSLGNPNGILCGIKPDKVKIYYNGEIILNDVLIGIYFGDLFCNNEYSSIIGLGSLKEELI